MKLVSGILLISSNWRPPPSRPNALLATPVFILVPAGTVTSTTISGISGSENFDAICWGVSPAISSARMIQPQDIFDQSPYTRTNCSFMVDVISRTKYSGSQGGSSFGLLARCAAFAASPDISRSRMVRGAPTAPTFAARPIPNFAALVLEMIDPEGAEKIAEYRRTQPEDASNLAMALNWGGSGWPSFQYYKPIFEIALHAKLEIAGGELPAHANKRQGSTDDDEIDPRRLASWRDTMSKAHCDLISAADLDAAARLQIARDDSMLQTASQVAGEHGTIVVAGRSHVRRDRNLPRSMHPDEIRYIALIEADTRSEPRTYLPPSINGAPPFDYIWFTPAKGGETACERLRRRGLIP